MRPDCDVTILQPETSPVYVMCMRMRMRSSLYPQSNTITSTNVRRFSHISISFEISLIFSAYFVGPIPTISIPPFPTVSSGTWRVRFANHLGVDGRGVQQQRPRCRIDIVDLMFAKLACNWVKYALWYIYPQWNRFINRLISGNHHHAPPIKHGIPNWCTKNMEWNIINENWLAFEPPRPLQKKYKISPNCSAVNTNCMKPSSTKVRTGNCHHHFWWKGIVLDSLKGPRLTNREITAHLQQIQFQRIIVRWDTNDYPLVN